MFVKWNYVSIKRASDGIGHNVKASRKKVTMIFILQHLKCIMELMQLTSRHSFSIFLSALQIYYDEVCTAKLI